MNLILILTLFNLMTNGSTLAKKMCMKPIQSKVGWKIFVFWWTASSKEEKGEVLECKGGLSEVQATGLYWPSVGLYNTMLHHYHYHV